MSAQRLRRAVAALLATEPTLTRTLIRETIRSLRPALHPSFSDDDVEALAREFESLHTIQLDSGHLLRGEVYRPWLNEARATIDPYYWSRYRDHLADSGFPPKVISSVDDISDEILGLLGNPAVSDPWDRRGLVVGHVQSGKTANYIALCSKAADAGYRVIIVIAGLHNRLRRQTQIRVDEGFIGRDTSQVRTQTNFVGVGRRDPRRQPNPFTHSTRDFNRATADAIGIPLHNLKEPAVFIIKKNAHILGSLLSWLKSHNRQHETATIGEPLLLIDDEADNASINIKHGPGEVSRINSQIRELLTLFERSCYVGYTATPFANIFIEPATEVEMLGDDLFPRDFIKSLDVPSNYYGPDQIFTADDFRSPIRRIEDHEESLPTQHGKEHLVEALPESLQEATRTFLLACAVRRLRGHEETHKSMLVNASRFNAVQSQIRDLLHDFVERIRKSIRIHGLKRADTAERSPEIAALRQTFETQYGDCGIAWPDILRDLLPAVHPVRVVEVNRMSGTPFDFPEGEWRSVIAVGGYLLSRGLTLEGLIISYFLRNSMMYDTLMQMGRWFGYRDGYRDLCRIWMLENAEGWYSHIAESIAELRSDLRYMSEIEATPKDFGLRVRSHPDALVVTARNKRGTGEIFKHSIGLDNRFVETAHLSRDSTRQQANRDAARRLAERLRSEGRGPESGTGIEGGRLVRGVPVGAILEFLEDFENDTRAALTQRGPLCEYIRRRTDELGEWDLYFAGVARETPRTLIDESLGFRLRCQRRAEGRAFEHNPHTLMVTSRQRVASRGVEKIGLSEDQINDAERRFREGRTGDSPPNYPDKIYRDSRTRPLFILHMLAIGRDGHDLSGHRPVVAYSISFPKTERPHDTVEYMANTTWMGQLGSVDEDEDEMEGDDDRTE